MRIEIKSSQNENKKPERARKRAVLISFDTVTKEFDSNYERNKFFRGLYGWKQVIKKKRKKYTYRREGLLDEVPHIKVADSAFIIAMRNMEKMVQYFDEWAEKVQCEMLNIMLNEAKWRTLAKKR